MIDYSAARLSSFAATWVGNKNRYEGCVIPSNVSVPFHEVSEELLINTVFKPFEKCEEFFYINSSEVDYSVLNIIKYLFSKGDNQKSIESLTSILYGYCENPRIQGGEFFVLKFDDLMLQGEPTQAICLWKVSAKNPVFKTDRKADAFSMQVLEGIPSAKPEVAAIIFNIDENEGYRIVCVDSVTKKGDRSFFMHDFLRLRPIEDHYFNTRHHIAIASDFIGGKMPLKFGLERVKVFEMINSACSYFKDFDRFNVDDFCARVFKTDAQRIAFRDFRISYQEAYSITLEDEFDISSQAVKKEQKLLKSVIRLDGNYLIQIKGRTDTIQRGFDEESGKKFYTIFFDNED